MKEIIPQIDDIAITFVVHKEEEKSAKKWHKKHIKKNKCKSLDGKLQYTFSNAGGIGYTVFASCTCGKSKNVTDYGLW